MIVSCALAGDFGAIISYEGEPPESLADLITTARELVAGEEPEHDEMRKQQMALMALWVAGTISAAQRAELAALDAALFNLQYG